MIMKTAERKKQKQKQNTNERHAREEELAFDNFIWVDRKTESAYNTFKVAENDFIILKHQFSNSGW